MAGSLKLTHMELPPFGDVYLPPGGEGQIGHLASEVKEYFDVGIELRPDDVVMDVGANVGVFAMHAAKVEPSIRIVCVEPIPALFAALQRNFETNPLLRNVKRNLHQMGLAAPGDPPEVEFLFFSRLPCDSTSEVDEKRRQFQRYFAAKGEAVVRWGEQRRLGPITRAVGAVLTWMPKGRIGRWVGDRAAGAERVRCKLGTADQVLAEDKIEAVGLLKVDVEGAELKVLEGFSPDRWARVRQVVLEGHDEDGRLDKVKALLARVGFDSIHVERPAIADERGLDNFLLYAKRTAN